jgi:multiple sugar transport system substrate-binding protein
VTIRRALIATIAVLTLAACSGSSGGGGDSAAPPAPAKHKPITITLWSGFTDRELGVINK